MTPYNHHARAPLPPSTLLGIKTIISTSLSYLDNHQGTFYIFGYACIPNLVVHMVSLEVLLYLRRSFPFPYREW